MLESKVQGLVRIIHLHTKKHTAKMAN